jgi:hypothetical protein
MNAQLIGDFSDLITFFADILIRKGSQKKFHDPSSPYDIRNIPRPPAGLFDKTPRGVNENGEKIALNAINGSPVDRLIMN